TAAYAESYSSSTASNTQGDSKAYTQADSATAPHDEPATPYFDRYSSTTEDDDIAESEIF
ncbi:hypothetical protein AAVH_37801, partial [Aphelenchoides avenae]